jgi:hypothetical protein
MMNDSQKVNYPIKYHWLLIAIGAGAVGFMVARALGLSQIATVTMGSVPYFLTSFPFMKHWMPKASFLSWLTAAAISTLIAWLLYFGGKALGY